ncbi:MAG: UDP-N-acetylmuramoyl-L-alanyl-D-glutamate--2,6-diaminopimelate ligase [Luteolibacter sp.]
MTGKSPCRPPRPRRSSLELQNLLGRMRDHGCRGVSMEVSSHGIDQNRIGSLGFDAAIFTNLTQDHLDYHGTMERYFEAKKSWFDKLADNPLGKKPVAVINVDDAYGLEIAESLEGKLPVYRYGFGVHTDFRANNLKQTARGMEFELTAKGKSFLVRAPLIGRFNVYNLLAAIAAVSACGIRPRESVAAIAEAPQVPGRMENIGQAGGATVFVDYAHTPDALENACRTLRELNPRRLITVFGCGGDRDRTKRPLMGTAAAQNSDICIITSDNPRSEDPMAIIQEIEKGMGGKTYKVIADREEAISSVVKAARAGDIVLIAGKGHETYQQFADRTIDFDDRKHAWKALRERTETDERP